MAEAASQTNGEKSVNSFGINVAKVKPIHIYFQNKIWVDMRILKSKTETIIEEYSRIYL